MAAFPPNLDARYRNANALRMAGQVAAAEAEFRAVLAANPAHTDATYSLAFMLREQGRTGAAASAVADWWTHTLTDADATLAAIGFIVECAEHARADAIARAAARRWPNDARIAARAGEIALALGQFDDAREFLSRAVERDPEQSASWLRLAHCRRFRDESDPDIARFAAVVRDERRGIVARICAGFALGKALDDVGATERAAAALRDANTQARRSLAWNPRAWTAFAERRLRETVGTAASPSAFEPVFVIGLPRTGTTLVSTLLARDPQVRDRGELNWIGAMYGEFFAAGRLQGRDALRACAAFVERQMRRDDAPARFYIDKNPLNFAYVDFIVALFPRARFVHCRRERRDTALSIWMQHFAHEDLGFAYDFSTIAQVDRDERRFAARWLERHAEKILTVDYEALVNDVASQRQRLADFLDLDAARLAQSEPAAAQTLTTASVWQARQPVYDRSIGRWERYAPYLPELAAF
ncbi:MAG TPA: sulfotransferase [Rudaea sp.]